MSLRDQLLKAGLADKKRVKKASKAAKKAAYDKRKTQLTDENDTIKKEIEDKKLAQKELDKKLNEQIEKQKQDKQRIYQAIDLAISRDLIETSARENEPYYFLKETRYIKSISVNDIQRMLLEKGELGIAGIEDRFYLLQLSDYEKSSRTKPSFIGLLTQERNY